MASSDHFYASHGAGARSSHYVGGGASDEDSILLARFAGAVGRSRTLVSEYHPRPPDPSRMLRSADAAPSTAVYHTAIAPAPSSCAFQFATAAAPPPPVSVSSSTMPQRQKQQQALREPVPNGGGIISSRSGSGSQGGFGGGSTASARKILESPPMDEDEALCSLLEAFPSLSLERIAETFVRAACNVHLAADYLSTAGKETVAPSNSNSNFISNSPQKFAAGRQGAAVCPPKSFVNYQHDAGPRGAHVSNGGAAMVPSSVPPPATRVIPFVNINRSSEISSKLEYTNLENGWRASRPAGNGGSNGVVYQNGDNYVHPPDLSGVVGFEANKTSAAGRGAENNNKPRNGLNQGLQDISNAAYPALPRAVVEQGKRSSVRLSANAMPFEYHKGKSQGNNPSQDKILSPLRTQAQAQVQAQAPQQQLQLAKQLSSAAVTGSVCSQMRSRAMGSGAGNGSGSGDAEFGEVVYRRGENDPGVWYHSGKVRKKSDAGGKGVGEDLGRDDFRNPMDLEFFHAMFGGQLAVDVIRDVFVHYPNEPDKALETLLNISSTSDGAHCSGDPEKIGESIYAFLEKPELGSSDGDGNETVGAGAVEDPDRGPSSESPLANIKSNEEFRKLCEDFPTVDHGYLLAVLRTSEFSYEVAVDMMREAGLEPAGKGPAKPKLDAREVLHSLFSSDYKNDDASDPDSKLHEWPGPWRGIKKAAGPTTGSLSRDPAENSHAFSGEVGNQHAANDGSQKESWCVVASKARHRKCPDLAAKLNSDAKGQWDEYTQQRKCANEHWQFMKDCMKEATQAYWNGDKQRASKLSEEGNDHKKLAQEASQRASQNIFNVKNKDIENDITIDLHAQHVAEAINLLRLHLKSLSPIPSVRHLRVITGQGTHSTDARPRIKPAITKYLERKGIPWAEPNPGCIAVAMTDVRALKANQRSP